MEKALTGGAGCSAINMVSQEVLCVLKYRTTQSVITFQQKFQKKYRRNPLVCVSDIVNLLTLEASAGGKQYRCDVCRAVKGPHINI